MLICFNSHAFFLFLKGLRKLLNDNHNHRFITTAGGHPNPSHTVQKTMPNKLSDLYLECGLYTFHLKYSNCTFIRTQLIKYTDNKLKKKKNNYLCKLNI